MFLCSFYAPFMFVRELPKIFAEFSNHLFPFLTSKMLDDSKVGFDVKYNSIIV